MRGIARVLATAPGGVRPLDDVSDLARLVRLPGTFNHKTAPPKPVRVVRWHPERRYDLRDFEELGIGADPVDRSPAAAAGAGTWTAAGGTIPQHTRNATLTRIAGALRARGLSPTAIEAALIAINTESCDPPLPSEEVARIARGMARYAPNPQLPAAGGHPAEARLLRLDGITPQRVRWLWPARIPLGKLTILDGDPGLGKSLIALDLAARVSTGRAMPDGATGDLTGPAGVVLLSAEDDPADTIRPRLDAAGGDAARVVLVPAIEEIETTVEGGTVRRVRAVTLADIEPLRQAIRIMVAKLVIIDPLMPFLTARTDPHIDARVRGLLAPLAALAAEEETAVLVVRHLNKTGGTNPIYRGGGSIAFIGAARAGLLVAPDPDDESGRRRVLAMTKSNLAEKAPSLQYTIEATDGGVPVVRWLGESTFDARALLAAPSDDDDRSALEEACVFLREQLAAGPVPARVVQAEARRAGIADKTLRRAKARLGVRATRVGFGSTGGWMWALPAAGDPNPEPDPGYSRPKMAKIPKDGHPKSVAIFESFGHLWGAQTVPTKPTRAGAGGDAPPICTGHGVDYSPISRAPARPAPARAGRTSGSRRRRCLSPRGGGDSRASWWRACAWWRAKPGGRRSAKPRRWRRSGARGRRSGCKHARGARRHEQARHPDLRRTVAAGQRDPGAAEGAGPLRKPRCAAYRSDACGGHRHRRRRGAGRRRAAGDAAATDRRGSARGAVAGRGGALGCPARPAFGVVSAPTLAPGCGCAGAVCTARCDHRTRRAAVGAGAPALRPPGAVPRLSCAGGAGACGGGAGGGGGPTRACRPLRPV